MQGFKIIVALKGFVNSMPLNTLSTEDKVSVRRLIDIITLFLHSRFHLECLTLFPVLATGG